MAAGRAVVFDNCALNGSAQELLEELMCERLRWVSHEAPRRGWQLLGRHRAAAGFNDAVADETARLMGEVTAEATVIPYRAWRGFF